MCENYVSNHGMPQFPEPYWRDSADIPSFPKPTGDMKVDVAIVGGGISGITTAYLLVKDGVRVALVEAGNLLNGTTGHTTAKITAQHDIIYNDLINHFGEEKAKLYYEANNSALQFIENTLHEHQIRCGFTREDACIYTNSEQYIKKIQDEYTSYQKLGISGAYVETISLSLPVKAAVVMKNQAQFHPLQYLAPLVSYIAGAGGAIYENTTAVDVEQGSELKVITRDGSKIACDHVISCSHFPFYDRYSFYFARMYAERSYVLGVKISQEYPGGMYLSAEDPKRSLRYTELDHGEKLILVGGESHKTGQGICTIKHYEALQAFADETFGKNEILYRWSTQDLTTLDKVPYVGQISSRTPNVLVATGYRKWGMSNGTAAALLLRDLVLGNDNPYCELYAPSRFHTDPDIKTFIVQNVDATKHFIEGKFEMWLPRPEDVTNGQGMAVMVDGKRCGAYRDDRGTLHIVDTTCTHMGCELEWNAAERSWDCPCHGSRFSYEGDIIEGPALNRLHHLGDDANIVEPSIVQKAPYSTRVQ